MSKTFKTETYRNHTVEYQVDDKGMFQASTKGLGTTFFKSHINGYSSSLEEVEKQMTNMIDSFRTKAPVTIGALARRIEDDATVWDSYEECHIDVALLEVLVENYIIANK